MNAGANKTLIKPAVLLALGILSGLICATFPVKFSEIKKTCSGFCVDKRNTYSDFSSETVRILCFVMTSNKDLESKTKHVRNTWLKRCNIKLFMGDAANEDFPIVGLKNRNNGFEATKEALRYAWENHKDKADWFLRADDETYVILENLRYFLKDKDPNERLYFGRKVKGEGENVIFDEKAGYVLSKGALQRFMESSSKCSDYGPKNINDISSCLYEVGVPAGDLRDHQSRELFHSHFISFYTSPPSFGHQKVLKKDVNPTCLGLDCTTNLPITFNGVDSKHMYGLEYVFYKAVVSNRCVNGYRF